MRRAVPAAVDRLDGRQGADHPADWRSVGDKASLVGLTLAAVAPDNTAAIGAALIERDGVLGRWFEQHGVLAAIVRPDHYIHGTARDLGDLAGLIDELARRSHPARRRCRAPLPEPHSICEAQSGEAP